MHRVVDGVLSLLRRFATWRSGRGERVWYLVLAALWLVDRARRDRGSVLWSGPVEAGQVLTVAVRQPEARRPPR